MKRFTPLVLLFMAFSALAPIRLLAQVNDGAMQVQMRFERYWAESGDDVFPDADEFVNFIRVQDYPNLDGVGWQNSSSTVNPAWGNGAFQTGGPYFGNFSPDWITTYTYGVQNSLGPQPSIEGFRMGFQGWEDDCHSCAGGFLCLGSPCGPPGGRTAYNSSCPCACDCLLTGGDDQFCDQEHLPNSFEGFRNGAPYSFTYQGVTHSGNPGFTGNCGGNDVGADYSTWWTSPCPDTLYANRTVICEPGLVTLFTGGAVFGGEYVWLEGTNFLQVTADIVPYLTVFVSQTTTYRVYTRNGGSDSWSYREIQIEVERPNISNIQVEPVSCNGQSDGLIRVNATTSNPPLEYSINNGNTYQLIDSFLVPAGNYIVKLRNPFCEVPTFGYPITVTEPGVLDATIADVDSVSCHGGNDGAIDLSVTGGNPPFSFNWSNGNSSEDNINIPAGSYSVTVTDNENCADTAFADVGEPLQLTTTISATDVTCAGASDGTATVVVSGGEPPYSYLWSNFDTSATATNLAGGVYSVVVTDANGCSLVRRITVNENPPLSLRLIVTDASCSGAADGEISIDTSVLGGLPPYTANWSNGGSGLSITNISAGTYSVSLTDDDGCVASDSAKVNEPDSLRIQAAIQDLACNGDSSGSIDVTVSGGTTPYSFQWSGNSSATSEDISDLLGGTYTLQVTDINNCTIQETYTVNEPAVLSAVISGTPPTCFGANDARASVAVSGGTAPYGYLWSNFSLADSAINLSGGIVTVIVTDDNGCETNDTINLPEPNEIQLIEKIGMVDCPGDSSGGIIITPVGGVQPYSYLWTTTGDTTNALSNLPAGTYTIVVTDGSGCTKSGTYTITEPPVLATVVTGNNPSCAGNATGFAVITVTGGTPGYTYQWSTNPPQNGVIGINLEAGIYTVTATDANSCTISDTVTITDPDSVSVTTVPTNITCFAGNDGRVEIRATGGSRPYKYSLNGIFQTDSVYTGLTEGNYIVVVEDNNACIGSTLFSITAPTGFSANAGPDQQIVRGDVAILSGSANSPNGIQDFNWSPGQDLSCTNCQQTEATPQQDQVYVLEVIDSQGCVQFDTVLVIVEQDYQNFFPTVFSPNGDGLNDNFDFELLGADGGQMTIYNRWGEQVYFNAFQANGAGNGWDGFINGVPAAEETYVYQLEVTYFDGETEVLSGTISIVR